MAIPVQLEMTSPLPAQLAAPPGMMHIVDGLLYKNGIGLYDFTTNSLRARHIPMDVSLKVLALTFTQ